MAPQEDLDFSVLDGWFGDTADGSIPNEWERTLVRLLDAAERTDQLEVVADRVTEHNWGLLVGSSEALASLAVREHDSRLLELALIAWCLAWPAADRFDFREAMPSLSVLWNAARLLVPDPAAFFLKWAERIPLASDGLVSFTERDAEGKTLAVMGRAEGSDEQGFRFVKSMPSRPFVVTDHDAEARELLATEVTTLQALGHEKLANRRVRTRQVEGQSGVWYEFATDITRVSGSPDLHVSTTLSPPREWAPPEGYHAAFVISPDGSVVAEQGER